MKRCRSTLSPSMVVACIALVFAMGGTGIAASHYLITSTSQISPKVRAALTHSNTTVLNASDPRFGYHSVPGPEGPRGLTGPTAVGPTGPQGPAGPTCYPAGLEYGGTWEPGSFTKEPDTAPCGQDETGPLREFPAKSHEWWQCIHGTVVRFNSVGCEGNGSPGGPTNEWERIQ